MYTSTTIYAPLVSRLKSDILTGRFPPGRLVGTEIALAAEAGISRSSVRLAIENLIEEGLVERRAGKGIFACKAQSGTRIVELAVPDLGHLWAQVAHGAQDAGTQHGVRLQIYSANRDFDADIKAVLALPGNGVDGAIIGAMHSMRMNEALFELSRQRFPFVLADQQLNDIDIPSVVFDNHQAGYLATQKLLELGHRRIGFVGYRIQMPPGNRADGYRDAVADAGLPFDRSLELLVPWDSPHGNRPTATQDAIESLLERPDRPTAIVFHTEHLAMIAYPIFKRQGVRIPDDISVVAICTDDIADVVAPSLATVTLPSRDMGQVAIDMLLKRLQDPAGPVEHRVLPVTWVARESVAAIG